MEFCEEVRNTKCINFRNALMRYLCRARITKTRRRMIVPNGCAAARGGARGANAGGAGRERGFAFLVRGELHILPEGAYRALAGRLPTHSSARG